MKVLQEGNPNGWEIEKECTGQGNGDGGCGARLLVAGDDIFVTASHCRDDTDYYYTFKCPCCGILTDIPEKEIPSIFKKKAMEEYRKKQDEQKNQ